jgi:hypothetical protein
MWYFAATLAVIVLIYAVPARIENNRKRAEELAAGKAVSVDWSKRVENIFWRDALTATVYFSNKDFPAELISPGISKDSALYIETMRFSTHRPMTLILTDQKPGFFGKLFNNKAHLPWPTPIIHIEKQEL